MSLAGSMRLALTEDARVHTREPRVVLTFRRGEIAIGDPSVGLKAAYEALSSRWSSEEELYCLIEKEDGATGAPALEFQLRRLAQMGLLRFKASCGDRDEATIVAMAGSLDLRRVAFDRTGCLRLSRFAYCHSSSGGLVLESPLGLTRLEILGDLPLRTLGAAVERLNVEAWLDSLGERGDAGARVMLLMERARILERVGSDGLIMEERNLALRQWEFHDLLFHARSREGFHNYPSGAVFAFAGAVESPSPVIRRRAVRRVNLAAADVESLRRHDRTFTDVVEARKSCREHDSGVAVTEEVLGQFLYRSARVRALEEADGADLTKHRSTNRPYPSAGGAYDLELYVVVENCDFVRKGIYHYDPVAHKLDQLDIEETVRAAMMYDARRAMGADAPPQVLITMRSRFARLSWKYRSIAYAAVLKNVGALMQTMYLVGEAMGLGCCALGSGNSRLLSDALNEDYFVESSVGEFALGVRRDVSRRP